MPVLLAYPGGLAAALERPALSDRDLPEPRAEGVLPGLPEAEEAAEGVHPPAGLPRARDPRKADQAE